MSNLYAQIIEKIDQANAQDPNFEQENGSDVPKELLYSQRMTEVLSAFAPDASDHLKIAARAQHIERWKSPRSDYPEGRAGYKKWRAELGLFHAKRTGELMADVGYSEDEINRVKYIVQKRGLRRDPETQTLEDVICLVFVLYYLDDFAKKHDEPKLIDIIQKTWAKMSDAGHEAALAAALPDHLASLVKKALSA